MIKREETGRIRGNRKNCGTAVDTMDGRERSVGEDREGIMGDADIKEWSVMEEDVREGDIIQCECSSKSIDDGLINWTGAMERGVSNRVDGEMRESEGGMSRDGDETEDASFDRSCVRRRQLDSECGEDNRDRVGGSRDGEEV